MSVLFADLVGFTSQFEQLDPEDVRAILSGYHQRVRSELERYGGTVEKFVGDTVMALFGAPVVHQDDSERAVRAALAVRDSIAELNAGDPGWDDLHAEGMTAVHWWPLEELEATDAIFAPSRLPLLIRELIPAEPIDVGV